MEHPPEITFRNLERSPAMEERVRERVAKLDRWFSDLQTCRVVIEADHRHHHKGNLYHVRVDVIVDGTELVAGREPRKNHAHEDAYVAIRDAFDAITRRLKAWDRKRRGDAKHHEPPPQGVVTALYDDYGIIADAGDRLIPFHANSVAEEAFDSIGVGTEVRFTEVMGEEGPRASTVHVIGKRHRPG